eukprot:g31027.t1
MNTTCKFTADITVLGWISNNRMEMEGFVTWCNENSLSPNLCKAKELIINFRKNGGEHTPIYFDGTEVERMKSMMFLGMTIMDDLSWTCDVDVTVKKTQQCHFFLGWLRKFGTLTRSLPNFHRCTIESILSGCTMAWYGNSSAQDREKQQKVVCTAETITEANLPSTDSTYTAHCHRKAANIIKDSSHP